MRESIGSLPSILNQKIRQLKNINRSISIQSPLPYENLSKFWDETNPSKESIN